MFSTSVVTAVGHVGSTHREPIINVSNFDGDRCRTLPPTLSGGPPSMSPTSVVTAVRTYRQHKNAAFLQKYHVS
jgi:hypothetical protein